MTLHFRGWTSFGYVKWRGVWTRIYYYETCPGVYVFIDQDRGDPQDDAHKLVEFMRILETGFIRKRDKS